MRFYMLQGGCLDKLQFIDYASGPCFSIFHLETACPSVKGHELRWQPENQLMTK